MSALTPLSRAKVNFVLDRKLGPREITDPEFFSEAEFKAVQEIYQFAANTLSGMGPHDPAFEKFFYDESQFGQVLDSMLKSIDIVDWTKNRTFYIDRVFDKEIREIEEIQRAYLGTIWRPMKGRMVYAVPHLAEEGFHEVAAHILLVTRNVKVYHKLATPSFAA